MVEGFSAREQHSLPREALAPVAGRPHWRDLAFGGGNSRVLQKWYSAFWKSILGRARVGGKRTKLDDRGRSGALVRSPYWHLYAKRGPSFWCWSRWRGGAAFALKVGACPSETGGGEVGDRHRFGSRGLVLWPALAPHCPETTPTPTLDGSPEVGDWGCGSRGIALVLQFAQPAPNRSPTISPPTVSLAPKRETGKSRPQSIRANSESVVSCVFVFRVRELCQTTDLEELLPGSDPFIMSPSTPTLPFEIRSKRWCVSSSSCRRLRSSNGSVRWCHYGRTDVPRPA